MTQPILVESPEDLLPALRALHEKTLGPEAQEAVRTLGPEERKAFVTERMRLAAAILHLETAALSELRQELEKNSAGLNQGIVELTQSLSELERASQWAQGLGKVVSTLSMILPVF